MATPWRAAACRMVSPGWAMTARPSSSNGNRVCAAIPSLVGGGARLGLGLVVLDVANPFFTDVARGVEDRLARYRAIEQKTRAAIEPGNR